MDAKFTQLIYQVKRQVSQIEHEKSTVIAQNEELTQLNKELDKFIYHTSHDLRAPLTSISGLIEIIELAEEEVEIKDYLGI